LKGDSAEGSRATWRLVWLPVEEAANCQRAFAFWRAICDSAHGGVFCRLDTIRGRLTGAVFCLPII